MAEKVQFELVSPERLVVSAGVDMVVVPGGDGDFGVLPGHAPLISTVRAGVIDVYEGSSITESLFVAGGVAEVTRERCTVLAEEAMPLGDLDRAGIEAEMKDIGEDMTAATDAAATAALEARLRTAEAKLAALARAARG